MLASLLTFLHIVHVAAEEVSTSDRLRSRLTSPRCAKFGVSLRDEASDWRAPEVVRTALQCQASCRKNKLCKFFTFYPESGKCYLGKEAKSKPAEAISGPEDCPSPDSADVDSNLNVLFIPGACHFNGQGELFEGAVQASQFAAKQAAAALNASSDAQVQAVAAEARAVARRAGLPTLQQQVQAAAAASAHAARSARAAGKDLTTQADQAATAATLVASQISPRYQAVLYALAAAFASGTGEDHAGRHAAVEVALRTALKRALNGGLTGRQREAFQVQVAGLTAAVNAKAAKEDPRQQASAAKSAAETQGSRSLLPKDDVIKLAKNAETLTDTGLTASGTGGKPVEVANLAWLCDGFNEAFGVDMPDDSASKAAQRAAAFLRPVTDAGNSAWYSIETAADKAVAKARSSGESVAKQVQAAVGAVEEAGSHGDIRIAAEAAAASAAATGASLDGDGAALRGHLASEAEKELSASPFEQAEAAAWASLQGNDQGLPEQAAAAGAAAEAAASRAGIPKEELKKVGLAATSVVLRGSWPQSDSSMRETMQSEEQFRKEMSAEMSRYGLVEEEDVIADEQSHWRWLIVCLIILAMICIAGVVLGISTAKTPKKRSMRDASLEPNRIEEVSLLNAQQKVPDPPVTNEPELSDPSEWLPSPRTQPPQLPQGPKLLAFPDWQRNWKPGDDNEVTYQVPPGAKPGSTLLVDVGDGFAVPTLVPESAYAGMTLSLRR